MRRLLIHLTLTLVAGAACIDDLGRPKLAQLGSDDTLDTTRQRADADAWEVTGPSDTRASEAHEDTTSPPVGEDTDSGVTSPPPDTGATEVWLTDDTSTADTTPPKEDVEPEVVRAPDPLLPRAIDDYIDARWDAPAEATAALVARITMSGATFDDVEAIIRAGPVDLPDATPLVGTVSEISISADHVVDFESSYWLALPASYDGTPAAVFVVTHHGPVPMAMSDARDAARAALDAYRGPLEAEGVIVIAPVTTRGWSPIGDSVVFTALSDLSRRVAVDPDRIHVGGHVTGGHMAWRSAMTHQDRYASFAPASGGYASWLGDGRLRALYGSTGFQTWCASEAFDIREANLGIRALLEDVGYAWVGHDLAGASHIPVEVMGELAARVADAERDMYKRNVFLRGAGTMVYDTNWSGQTEAIRADRAYRWNQRRWLELVPDPASGNLLEAFASVVDERTISIVSNHVRKLAVYLHPAMGLDLEQDLRIIVNGQVRFEGHVDPDWTTLLELVREWDDRGRLYRARVQVTVPTDEEVGLPVGLGQQ